MGKLEPYQAGLKKHDEKTKRMERLNGERADFQGVVDAPFRVKVADLSFGAFDFLSSKRKKRARLRKQKARFFMVMFRDEMLLLEFLKRLNEAFGDLK